MCVFHLQQSSVQLLSSVNSSQGTGKTQVWQGKSSNNLHDMPTLVHSSSLTFMRESLPHKRAAMLLSTACQL